MSPAASDAESIDFERRFSGVRRLYGAAALERFRRAHVYVIGIGGVGAWAAEALARSAVGRLTLIDPDHVAESNINRQTHALSDTLGQAKVEAMRARIHGINPACEVTGVEASLEASNLAQLLAASCDHVLDAIDDARTKTALIVHCRNSRLPLVCVGAAGGQTDPGRIQLADLSRTTEDPLLAKVRATLRREHGFPREPGRKFGVECVFSTEPLRYPGTESEACDGYPPNRGPRGLSCAGFGSSVCVTASFGLRAAARVLDAIATRRD